MSWTEKRDEMRTALRAFNKAAPDATRSFGALSKTAKASGAIDHKTKEFVALGIAVSARCEPCILFHVEALLTAGAKREEVVEVLEMALQMGGGPSLMYAAKALACFDEMSGAAAG